MFMSHAGYQHETKSLFVSFIRDHSVFEILYDDHDIYFHSESFNSIRAA